MKFATRAIHAGQEPDKETGAIMPPLYLTSTFVQESPGEHKGYDYTRAGHPNFTRLETMLAALEGGAHATVFSSGLGATTAWLSSLSQGDSVLAINGLYGGTYRLFHRVFAKFGVKFQLVNGDAVEKALADKPKWLFFETPTNPLLEVYDIAKLTTAAKKFGVRTIVDNTFASPYFQSPLALGADAVLHSTTKYIGGHSDLIGGAIITNDPKLKEEVDFSRKAMGLNPSPFDTWLTARGIKTLALRMEQHQKNALAFAAFLSSHPLVKRVYYPATNPIAKKQMRGFSGIVSVEFNCSLEETKKIISSLKIFSLAESLGGVESLVCHPATMTHASIPQEERLKSGLSDGLVRFSVGVEDVTDIIADIAAALANKRI